MSPVAFTIGGFEIRWYSILIVISVIIAYVMIINESDRFKIKHEFVFNMMFWTLIIGIIGARLYYVLFNFKDYVNNPIEILKVWKGGLAIHGGLLAGLITLIIYCKRYNMRVGKILDIVVVPLILGQAIGRWGNFFNHEAYGDLLSGTLSYDALANMKIIPKFIINNMYINGSYHLPMFYFESIWCLIGFIIMLVLRRRRYIKEKQILGFYLMWYGVARVVIEIFRTDSLMIGNIKVAIVVSVLMFIIGFVITAIQSGKPKLDELYNKQETSEIKF